MFHTFNLNIHYFINCFLPFSAYGVNIIIIQLQKAINIIDYLVIFDQSVRKVHGDLPAYKTGKSGHFSTVIGRRQQWCYIPLLWVSVITCKRGLFLTIVVLKNWLSQFL